MTSKQRYKMFHAHLRRLLNAGKSKGYLHYTIIASPAEQAALRAAQLSILATGRQPAKEHNHALSFSWNYGPNARVKVA